MPDSADLEGKLRQLTQRQCVILYWIAQGLTLKEIAAKIGFGEDLVMAELSRIYRQFDLTDMRKKDKRRILEQDICPLHLQMVSNLETDCREHIIEVNAPPPPPSDIREVVDDVEAGVLPIGALVVVNPPKPKPTPPPGPLVIRRGNTTFTAPPRETIDTRSRIPWILAGVLGTLLILALIPRALEFFGAVPSSGTSGNEPPTIVTRIVEPSVEPSAQTVVSGTSPSAASPVVSEPIGITLPFSDDFESGIRPEWIRAGGEWNMSNGRLRNAGNRGTIWLGKTGWKDLVVEGDIEGSPCVTDEAIYLLIRMQDPRNYIFINMRGCGDEGIYLVREGQGVLQLAWKSMNGKHFRVEMAGQIIKVEIDGQPALSASDEVFGSGSVGIQMSRNGTIDNIVVTERTP